MTARISKSIALKGMIFALSLFGFLSPVSFASAYYQLPRAAGFANDFTSTLTIDQNRSLEKKLSQFEADSTNEIAVAIIDSLGGDTVENFAVKLFEDWQIGKKDKDNGVLILIAKDDRQMRIEVGYGLEGSLTDSQAYWIIQNEMRPAFKNNDFYGGINAAINKIIAATKGEYVPSGQTDAPNKSKSSNSDLITLLLFSFWMIPIWLVSVLSRSKSWWGGGIVGAVLGGIIWLIFGLAYGVIGIVILAPLGLALDYLVSNAYQKGKATGHYPWWIGGKSGFGGGSGGGGFGGFGGGSSGGGGASGSW